MSKRYGARNGDMLSPMEFTAQHHDFGAKNFLGGQIPSGLNGNDDLEAAIDIIFEHANVAPFISQSLIKRLTHSNPSPQYIQRVARIFNDNGRGVKGDLKAVLRAILLDREARSEEDQKFKEPFLRFTQFLRAFKAEALNNWKTNEGKSATGFELPAAYQITEQFPGFAPSVFNFYVPSYVPADDDFYNYGITAPEHQIHNEQTMIVTYNTLKTISENLDRTDLSKRFGSISRYETANTKKSDKEQKKQLQIRKLWKLTLSFDDELKVLETAIDGDTNGDFSNIHNSNDKERGVIALVDHLNYKLAAGRLDGESRAIIVSRAMTADDANKFREALAIITEAVLFISTSSAYTVQ